MEQAAGQRLALQWVRFGILQARRGWVAPGRVVNAWGLAKLRQWLASR